MLTRLALASLALVLAQSSALAAPKTLSCIIQGGHPEKVTVTKPDGTKSEALTWVGQTVRKSVPARIGTQFNVVAGDFKVRITIQSGYLKALIWNTRTNETAFGYSEMRENSTTVEHYARLDLYLNPSQESIMDADQIPGFPGTELNRPSADVFCTIE